MAVLVQTDIANQLMRQLRILDPSASMDIGTPERKIIDTVAQGLADSQIDLAALTSSFDIDTKVGDDLDAFLSIFNFARQKGSAAIGIVEFSRITPSNLDIVISAGTQVAASASDGSASAIFATTQTTTLVAGQTAVDIPVQSITIGAFNNVAANTINLFTGAPIQGITTITNPTPTTQGSDAESDAQFRLRFKNTVFRNLAGTGDQYLALAVAGAFSNKANVIGPISRYREYIQVPDTDDLSNTGNGAAHEWTTALSTIPYSKFTYSTVPNFISNGDTGVSTIFYTEDIDFRINLTDSDRNAGDTYRNAHHVPPLGLDPITDADADFQPNVTFLNVYTGADEAVTAVRPEDVVLFEHSYISSASRNDYNRALLNCVDVYINGENPTPATTVIPSVTASSIPFQDNPTNRYHYENYRRVGEPEHRPFLGNYFTPLYWTPIESLPSTIVVGTQTYTNGIHYFPVIDITNTGGSVRAKTGIEWSAGISGATSTGEVFTIVSNPFTSITVSNYTFDKNIVDLQSALEGAKQVTTDVLVHKATERYFKFDISVMYTTGASVATTNQAIANNVRSFLENLYFGSFIQLSDILQVVHNTPGVDNVRWSRDIDVSKHRVQETDINGAPRLSGAVDRPIAGSTTEQEAQTFYFTGNPTAGTVRLQDTVTGDYLSDAISFDADLAAVQAAVDTDVITAPSLMNIVATGQPGYPFWVQWITNGPKNLLRVVPSGFGLTGDTNFETDFPLRDNELATLPDNTFPGDTVPGFIIRPRAQNTWLRGGS